MNIQLIIIIATLGIIIYESWYMDIEVTHHLTLDLNDVQCFTCFTTYNCKHFWLIRPKKKVKEKKNKQRRKEGTKPSLV